MKFDNSPGYSPVQQIVPFAGSSKVTKMRDGFITDTEAYSPVVQINFPSTMVLATYMENPDQSRTGSTGIAESSAVSSKSFLMSPSGDIE